MTLKTARFAHNKQSSGKWTWFDDGTELGAPPTPPTGGSSSGMLLGISEWTFIFDQGRLIPDLAAINPQATIQCVRRYDGNIPANFSSSSGQADVGQGRASWVSFNGPTIQTINSGSYDATLASYFASIPANHRHFFTYKHEVDNNKDDAKLQGATIAQFVTACERIWTIKNANAQNPANVLVGPILTAGPYRGGNYRAYYSSTGKFDFIGADPYRFYREPGCPPDPKLKNSQNADGSQGTLRSMAYLIGELPTFSQETGKPCAIGEYGAHPYTTDLNSRPNWLQQPVDFLRSINTVFACYFHSGAGESGPWQIDRWHFNVGGKSVGDPEPASLAKFAAILAANKVVVT